MSLTFLGSGQSWMILTFPRSIRKPPGPVMWPGHSTESVWKTHFSPLAKRLGFQSL